MKKSVAILGATGAVGTETLKALLGIPEVVKISTFGRSPLKGISDSRVHQHKIDISDPDSYKTLIKGHNTAICTLGVGQPSKVSKEDFIKVDKTAVIHFAEKCREQGVQHFELLASVGISPAARNFFLRTKGELVEDLRALKFQRLSIFMPSMILTPTNRYGFTQAVFLKTWPVLSLLMFGRLKKYRGIKVEELGEAMANNIISEGKDFEKLTWEEFQSLQ